MFFRKARKDERGEAREIGRREEGRKRRGKRRRGGRERGERGRGGREGRMGRSKIIDNRVGTY